MADSPLPDLKPMTDDIEPIALPERLGRVEKARRLMAAAGLDALLLEGGSSLLYFTGVAWGRSERLTAAVLPARGEVAYVCPAFEEARLREQVLFGSDVRTWQEDEDPFRLLAGILADRGIARGRIGIEPTVRFFVCDGLARRAPQAELVAAGEVVSGCRAVKSPAEIALIQRATDITVAAYKACLPLLEEGMPQEEFRRLAAAAHQALGARGGIDIQFGASTAFPHGSRRPTTLRAGDVVLMDGGCTVDGYHSDISRTIVFGEPTPRQREIWQLEQRAQAAGFEAARLGAPCEAIDAAARKVITDAGLGPDYAVPGLPHRTGHGIGLDVHEAPYIVRGNTAPLEPGMCFSDEPMIAIYGEFGVRLEDCICMTESGPRFFSTPSPAIDRPFA